MAASDHLPFELQIGWRYLRGGRNRARNGFVSFIAALSVVGITLGVAALIVVLSVMNGFRSEVRDRMLDVIAHVELQSLGPQAPDTASWAARALRDAEVVGAAPFAALQGLLGRGEVLRAALIQGVDPALEPRVSGLAQRLSAGANAPLQHLKPGSRAVLLGGELARALRLRPGDPVALVLAPPPSGSGAATPAPRTLTLRFVGAFESGHFQYDDAWALMHIDDVRQLLPGREVSGVRLRLADASRAPWVAARLAPQWSGTAIVRDWSASNRPWFEAVAQQKRMLGLILTLIVAVAAFNLVSTLVMTVTDKRADIAILRTLGASPRSVMAIFVVQGALAGVIGTLAGVALGLAVALNVDVIVPAIEAVLGAALLPASVYLVSRMPSLPLASDIVPIALVSVVLALLATLYPSWRASRVEPALALHEE
jgi:lipoprotein-releasing system permease protein